MRLRSDGWGMANAAGCSEVGFGRCLGDDYFILIVSGMPRFNQEAFTTLVGAGRALRPHLDLNAMIA